MRHLIAVVSLLLSPAVVHAEPVVEDVWGSGFSIEFKQPMVTWQTDVQVPAIRITPHLDCLWSWDDDTVLSCSLPMAEPRPEMRRATIYRVELGKGLWTQSGEELAPTEVEVVSDPPQLMAGAGDWKDGRPTITLWSWRPLEAASIAEVLDVRIDNKPLPYRLETLPPDPEADPDDKDWRFRVHPLAWPDADARLTLALREGLRSPEGDARGEADPELLSVRINETFDFISLRCTGLSHGYPSAAENGCLRDHPILMLFSKPLAPEGLTALAGSLPDGLALAEPPAECDYECGNQDGAPRSAVVLQSRLAETELSLRLPASLRAADGSLLGDRARDVAIRMRAEAAGFRVQPPVLLALPDAATPVPLESRNIAEERRWDELLVGRRIAMKSYTVAARGPRNDFNPVAMPGPSRDLLARGGLAWGGLRDNRNVARATAVAAFQLLASERNGRVIAWATDWASGEGIAGAALELLEVDRKGGQRLLARGITGADGVGRFDFAAPPAADGVQRFLRATAEGRRTVVPLNRAVQMSLTDPEEDGETRFHWWERGSDIPSFGVSERLLYRPGERVKYRVWRRDRDGNRLLRADGDSTAMQLVAPGYEATQYLSWKAPLDEWGSVAGELKLPETLPDGEYCIGIGDKDAGDASIGACFRVARFSDQSLWAELKTHAPLLRGGDRLHLEIEGGYYSGGPAAAMPLAVTALMTPVAFDEAYPAYAGFEFIEPVGDFSDVDLLAGFTLPTELDARGHAMVDGTLPGRFMDIGYGPDAPAAPIAFGTMQFNASLQARGHAPVASPTASVTFAQYGRYVGLRGDGWWFSTEADPVLEAVVVSDTGEAIPGTAVSVRIERRADGKGTGEVLARCELATGKPAACPFKAPAPGVYEIVAESADAAPTRLARWFGREAPRTDDEDQPEATLQLLQAAADGSPARLRLRQPHGEATALFVVEYDDVLHHWTQAVGTETDIEIALRPEWAPTVLVRALIRPRAADAARGLLEPTLDAALKLDVPGSRRGGVGLQLADDALAPGERATVRLHNSDHRARLVTVAVVDDSVHQQVADLHERIDPGNEHFLGRLRTTDWPGWLNLQDWEYAPNPFYREDDGQRRRQSGSDEYGREEDSATLDTIEVTGSRVKRADIFPLVPATTVLPGAPRSTGGTIARTRSHFPEAAYWNPGVVLAAGERRELTIDLPDNLTRWRVLVWSSDADDGFSLEQATLTASLPLELRLSLPGRLYEDDQASGSLGVRAVSQAASVQVAVQADGAGVAERLAFDAEVAANATLSRLLAVSPDRSGDIDVLARASSANGADAVSGRIPVHSRWAEQRRTQAGWLEGSMRLPLPALPEGARDASVSVTVSRGLEGWRRDWLDGLRAYPHRCWEQTLSRAVGAALALQDAADHGRWPEAEAVIDEAFASALSFQDDEGLYRYFPPQNSYYPGSIDLPLSASTLRAYVLLDQLGHPVPGRLRQSLQNDLAEGLSEAPDSARQAESAAVAAGALAAAGQVPDAGRLLRLWNRWDRMSWFARAELVRALAASPASATLAAEGIERLREAGRSQGLRRVIEDDRDFAWAMGSSLRDQCAVTATLWDLDTGAEGLPRRRELLRGVQDLYAGGTPGEDTQASVHCLLALRAAAAHLHVEKTGTDVALRLGDRQSVLAVGPERNNASFRSDQVADELLLETPATADSTLNYRAELSYRQDQRDLAPTGTGFLLQRRYSVLRGGRWQPVAESGVREGDWIRVTLQLDTGAWRHFVALTDPVPGGWVTRDPTLANVAGADLQRLAEPGSWWFDTRQTGADVVRLYAERLPPGRHEVHYYAQAVHHGRYFAPPATAELMYGRNSHSNTAADQVTIGPAR